MKVEDELLGPWGKGDAREEGEGVNLDGGGGLNPAIG